MKKQYSKKQIQEAIKYWENKLSESIANNIPYDVTVITDKDILKKLKHDIFNLVQLSYKEQGGFKGASDARNLIRDTDLAKIVFDENDNIIALALYRDDLDGHKRFCSATNKLNPKYKEAHQKIIITDIEPYSNWYWTVVSGKNEHYFKKYNGNPIPNHIAVELLGLSANPSLKLDSDGIHFSYMTKGDDPILMKKMVFGFNNQDTYDTVMKSIENYEGFKLSVDNLSDHMNESKSVTARRIKAMCMFISKLFDMHNQDKINEIPKTMYDDLISSINKLEQLLKNKSYDINTNMINAVLRRAYICKNEIEPMSLHQINIDDIKKHLNLTI